MAWHEPMDLPGANHLAAYFHRKKEEESVDKSMREYGSATRQHDLFDRSRLGRRGEAYK